MYIPFSELVQGDLFYFHPSYEVEGLHENTRFIKMVGYRFQEFGKPINELSTFKLEDDDVHRARVRVDKESTEPNVFNTSDVT